MFLVELAFLFSIPLAATAVALWYFTRHSRRLWKITARIAAVVLLCASVLPALGLVYLRSWCNRYEFPPIPSRDGSMIAEVNEKDCGAIDSYHSSVYLWQRREGFFAHVFGKRAHLTTVFTSEEDSRFIDLEWKDDRTLLIRYPSGSRPPEGFECESQWRGIRIECVGYEPDYSKPPGKMPPVKTGFW
jgi:hypothetical protein